MKVKVFHFFFLLFFLTLRASATPPNLVETGSTFAPDFGEKAFTVPQGMLVSPVCVNSVNISCMSQWAYQAALLSMQQGPSPIQYRYFLPVVVPYNTLSKGPMSSNDRLAYSPSVQKYSGNSREFNSRPRRRGAESSSRRARVVTSAGEESSPSPKPLLRHKTARDVTSAGEGVGTTRTGKVAFISVENLEPVITADVGKPTMPTSGKATMPTPTYRVSETTIALPATMREVKPGCFVMNKPESKTEGAYCFECFNDSALNEIAENIKMVRDLNENIQSVDKSSLTKQGSKILSVQEEGITDLTICSPETSLKHIIKNFENDKECSPYNGDFKKFAKKASCESCKKGVPPEIMLAMMSIESAGKCSAVGVLNKKTDERSGGLFQVDSSQHQCVDSTTAQRYQTKDPKNLQCLKDPINNLNVGIDILAKHYGEVNPNRCTNTNQMQNDKRLKCKLKAPCKDWSKADSKERDSWRRAVSAYNGGSEWLVRALYAARNMDKTLKDTGYMEWTHTFKSNRECDFIEECIGKTHSRCDRMREKYGSLQQVSQNCRGVVAFRNDKGKPINWDLDWEILRAYYLLEKLSPGNTTDSGRQLRWTVSNLAHTEAVLGREVKSGGVSHGMVEVWEEYIRKNKLECK